MNKETQSIIRRIENVNSGEPWFGRAVFVILEEVDAKKVFHQTKLHRTLYAGTALSHDNLGRFYTQKIGEE